MAGRFSVEAVFKAVDRITAPISKMQNRVSKFTRSMRNGLRSANRAVDKLSRGLTKGLRQGAVAVARDTGQDYQQGSRQHPAKDIGVITEAVGAQKAGRVVRPDDADAAHRRVEVELPEQS